MHSLRELKKSLKELDSKKKRRKGSGEGDSGAIGVDRAGDDRHVGGGEDAAFVQASKANLKMPPSLEDQKASGGSCSVSADGHGDDVGVSNVTVELVDPSQQEAAVVVHTQMNKRKAPPSPRERSGANNGKKVKICMEAEEKEKNGTETEEKKVEGCCKVKNSTEAEEKKVEKNCSEEARDGGSKGSCSNGGTPDEEPTERGEGLRAGSVNEESEVSRSNYPRSLAGIGRSPNVPKVAVAVSPNMPWRYGYLLKLLTFLFLTRVKWKPEDKKTLCWMFNTLTRMRVQFLVNPAFTSEVLDVKVKRPACSFSSNFGDDEAWGAVKEVLEMMFCPPKHKPSEEPDHLYIFTRIDNCIYFRNMKIDKKPAVSGDTDDDGFVLK